MTQIQKCLAEIAKQEKQFHALYRNVGATFGLPDCAMWVLYYLAISKEVITQQKLTELMMFPKQTINSAVTNLANKEYVELQVIAGTRNKKKIVLTPSGTKLSQRTVSRMYDAECRAASTLGAEKMSEFLKLYSMFYESLNNEFRKEGLVDEN